MSGGLLDGFLGHAAEAPDRPALVAGGRSLTYGEMAATAARWAGRLHDAVGAPGRIGVFGDRTPDSYVGIVAALHAGAAFVPLNPRYPRQRTASMIEQAGLDAILAPGEAAAGLRSIAGDVPVLDAHTLDGGAPVPAAAPGPDDLAYLLFTSGSTGRPKGVPIAHRNLRAFLDVTQRRYGLGPDDRLSQTFEQTFDLSVFDLFMAWSAGASVHVLDDADLLTPLRFVREHALTVWFSVPSVAALVLRRGRLDPGTLPSLRWSLFCGEGLPRAVAEAWQAAAPRSVVENLYGPTELTIACAAYRWRPESSPHECVRDLVPIGEVFDGLRAVVVDERLRDVAAGTPGELCVAGPQAFGGYWRAPELSEERFLTRTGPSGAAERFYRTGDLVARRGDRLVFLGRTDQQVKVRGCRIELGEIESVLREAGCVDAVALPWPDASRPDGIVAAVSGHGDVAAVTRLARERLPAFMVPRAIHVIADMPLNANGKVDRAAVRAAVEGRAEPARAA